MRDERDRLEGKLVEWTLHLRQEASDGGLGELPCIELADEIDAALKALSSDRASESAEFPEADFREWAKRESDKNGLFYIDCARWGFEKAWSLAMSKAEKKVGK